MFVICNKERPMRALYLLGILAMTACGGDTFEATSVDSGGGSGGDAGAGHPGGAGGAAIVGGGEACDGVTLVCEEKFYCDASSHRCVLPLGAGGEGGSGAVVVGPGEFCDEVEFVCDDSAFCDSESCIPKIASGLPCELDSWCKSGSCDTARPMGILPGTCD